MGLRAVGRSLPRSDALDKVMGRERFVSDLVLPGMAHGAVARSAVAHGRLRHVDTSRTRALPGVLAVVTGADLGGCDPFYGPALKDQPLLALDRVRYVGEPVAAVVATDERTAREACGMIEIEVLEAPAALTLDEALAPGAPVLHERLRPAGHFRDLEDLQGIPGSNICHHYHFEQGDVEGALAGAAVVAEDTFVIPAVHHYPMEPYGAVALWEAETLTLWSAAQHPFLVRKELAEMFGLPLHQIRVIVPAIGGAFGTKCYTKLEPLAAVLARAAGRPVRLMLSVAETFQTLIRHAARIHMKTAADRQGHLVARQVHIHLDTGAYADVGPRVAEKAGFRAKGPYRIPHLRVDSAAVYTNKVPAGAYRGYGTPQVTYAAESQLDVLAARLGLDPVEFRLRNLLRRGEELMPGHLPLDADLPADLRALAERVRARGPTLAPGAGRGFAVGVKDGGGSHTISMALVRLHSDGTASVLQGAVEMGQGARTALAQIAAEELGIDPAHVDVSAPDTGVVPFDQGTSASRSTVVTGLAVQRAAADVKGQLARAVAAVRGTPPEAIEVGGGRVTTGAEVLDYARVIQDYFGLAGGELVGVGVCRPDEEQNEGTAEARPGGTVYWEVGLGAAEVRVDSETGLVSVRHYYTAADVGRAINPALCEGQEEGGAVQGLGHALFEALVFDGGQMLNGTLIDYRVPLFADFPGDLSSVLFEREDGPGPYGAKGIGESGVIPVAPAVANAVAAATGIRITELPLSPERVWRALRDRSRAAAPAGEGTGRPSSDSP